MSDILIPKKHILPPHQIDLWPHLREVPHQFVLYGGTALALQLGHRESVDFDFFCFEDIDPSELLSAIPFLAEATTIHKKKNTLDVSIERKGGTVKVSFFGLPSITQILPPLRCEENNLNVASVLDIAGMKVSVVQQRSELKDYVDIAAILKAGDVTLPMALSAAQAIYGVQFNPMISLKALAYFDDGNVRSLPKHSKDLILYSVAKTDLNDLPPVLTSRNVMQHTGLSM